MKDKKWFLDRVGKKVYRTKTPCDCEPCTRCFYEGLIIADKDHAQYVFDIKSEYNNDGANVAYFDTVEERDSFENKSINT